MGSWRREFCSCLNEKGLLANWVSSLLDSFCSPPQKFVVFLESRSSYLLHACNTRKEICRFSSINDKSGVTEEYKDKVRRQILVNPGKNSK